MEADTPKTNKHNVILQEVKVRGDQLVEKVREIIEEGNARRVYVKKEGRTLIEFPLSVGVGGATAALFLAPTLAAIGAFAALVTDVTVEIEKIRPDGPAGNLPEPPSGV